MDANLNFGRNMLRILIADAAFASCACDTDHERVAEAPESAGATRSRLDSSSDAAASAAGGRESSRYASTRGTAVQGTSEHAADYGSANTPTSADNGVQGGAGATRTTSLSSAANGTREAGDTTGNQSGGTSSATQVSQTRASSTASGGASSPLQSTGSAAGGAKTTSATSAAVLCVFDYDLTLTTHACAENEGVQDSSCRVADDCGVYGWSDQCIAGHARAAVGECVKRGAYIGIASHSPFEGCWDDKIVPIVTERQFPELIDSPHYNGANAGFVYPAIDVQANWNCDDCAYQMETSQTKSVSIARIMRHYGMNPDNPSDRKHVLFWDDDPNNIDNVKTQMPEVVSVTVPRRGTTGADGGCGITPENIEAAWAQLR